MEIYEMNDAYLEACEDPTFDHTKIIFRKGDNEYFYAKSSQRIFRDEDVDVDTLETIKIPVEHIWPLADPEFTRAPEPLPETCYIKRQNLINYEAGPNAHKYGEPILTEIKACEVLRKHPHPNIVRYLGCVVKDGRVRGLAFEKHTLALQQMLKEDIPFDKDRCLDDIEAGIRHMHDLGLVHNDINPSNILMNGNDPVIIDFDSTMPEGQLLNKGGTYGYSLDEDHSKISNDLYSLSRLRKSVMEGKIFNEVGYSSHSLP
ncbi:kinase-like domain-containing protein [Nemania sp. FL0031]|nr:kinase-like domain-containing protein [Nemania sp. FL0031]